ncbi:hypothetical protein GCM10022251_60270 [Phytohabitans flavus]|uniref:Replicase polyprotein 1ab n=1 Tax=Phytohabitans flavus TaxID=1076124 RepID=A0A6F8XKN1_9ACTN|nr:hypothetical protein Pflav_007730 [Phytohabitans flavus]
MAETVARHLVAAGQLIDEDPEGAMAHALAARRLASRIAVVREAVGLAAYAAGEWQTAIAELRTYHRMSGKQTHLAVLADCERALGRPERAVDIYRAADRAALAPDEAIELLIVAAGARGDMGQKDAAVAMLQVRELAGEASEPWAGRLRYAYADALLAVGRREEAREWFARAADADPEATTDAAERLLELDGVVLTGDEKTDLEEDESAAGDGDGDESAAGGRAGDERASAPRGGDEDDDDPDADFDDDDDDDDDEDEDEDEDDDRFDGETAARRGDGDPDEDDDRGDADDENDEDDEDNRGEADDLDDEDGDDDDLGDDEDDDDLDDDDDDGDDEDDLDGPDGDDDDRVADDDEDDFDGPDGDDDDDRLADDDDDDREDDDEGDLGGPDGGGSDEGDRVAGDDADRGADGGRVAGDRDSGDRSGGSEKRGGTVAGAADEGKA